ncbi:DNA polymerase III subunit epsilon [Salmonella enterica subsp. enterica]|nr:DNA polymerase III subunit epsilon [Salmonella enterica subsp. enterica]
MEKEQLVEIANTVMPFGKYQGRRLIDLPEEYLLWFARKDQFPAGKLGELMQITLLIKTEGADATGTAPETPALSFRGAAFLLRL